MKNEMSLADTLERAARALRTYVLAPPGSPEATRSRCEAIGAMVLVLRETKNAYLELVVLGLEEPIIGKAGSKM